ncbi:hypothetical protein DPMN_064931 [Dreissena polymorpha]|uniref:Uncharacterized protein n=1 Tax=Dreissena polymorpha TaxID=45954 RepID=A0A9D4HKK5_DREPO|nr:hypothetical protein DPMN_064931 [Dreissena polymorpha]
MRELDAIRTAHHSSLKKDVEKCNKLSDELKELIEAVQDLEGKDKAELAFIASKKSHSKIQESESFLKETSVAVDRSFSFQPNTDIVQYLSKQVGLGNIAHPNHVLTVSQSNEFDLSILSDLCVIANNRIIVTDYLLKRVKLLDQNYKVINQLDMPHYVRDMCKISSNEVAVTLFEGDRNLVQFICVNNGQLVKGKQLQFQHKCAGIAHHEGKLFVTSRTALYQYSLSGELLKKYLEDTSSDKTGKIQ